MNPADLLPLGLLLVPAVVFAAVASHEAARARLLLFRALASLEVGNLDRRLRDEIRAELARR